MLSQAGFQKLRARRILYTHKSVPGWALPAMKLVDFVGEKTPGLNQLASIVMAGGSKR
jgi:hypothetical protein